MSKLRSGVEEKPDKEEKGNEVGIVILRCLGVFLILRFLERSKHVHSS